METRGKVKFLPMGSILDRYLAHGFLRAFIVSLICIASLYLVVDFFDRISTFVDNGASLGTIIRYFFYKAPVSISRVIGFATLFSALFCLGMLARTQEIIAMRSSGISVQRIAFPLLIFGFLICLFSFFWNEALVPIFTHQAQTIFKTEVKNKQQQSLFGTADIWIRGEGSFINVNTDDLKLLAREAEEFTFFDLQKQISDMKSKGIDATSYEVDIQSKVAFPLISPLMILIAVPFALRRQMSGGMAMSFGVAMIIGFGYWVLSAFCISLGHNGALPPWTAAWVPNAIFALIGLFFFTAET